MKRKFWKTQAAKSRPFGPALTAIGLAMMSPALLRSVHFDPNQDTGGGGNPVKTSIDKLKAAIQTCSDEADTLDAAYQAEESDEGKAKIDIQIKAKAEEFKKLDEQLIRATEMAAAKNARLQSVGKATTLASLVPAGVNPASIAAEAKNQDSEDAELEKQFENFIFSHGDPRSMSDAARDALRPKGKSWDKAKDGIRVPKRLARIFMPNAKALPLTTLAAPGSQLQFTEQKPELLMHAPIPPALFERTNRVPTQTGRVTWPRLKQGAGSNSFGGVVVAWTAQGADKAETEPQIDQLTVEAGEISAYTELAKTLINRSSVDIQGVLGKLFRPAIMFAVDQAIVNGDGIKKPKGILQVTGLQKVNRAIANQVSFNDLVDLEFGVPAQLRANCSYAISDTALKYIKKLKDSQNRPLFQASDKDGMPATVNGYPFTPTQCQPALGTLGDVIFGDLTQYITAVEDEVVIASSEHYKFRSGVVAFVVFMLVGGELAEVPAVTALDVP